MAWTVTRSTKDSAVMTSDAIDASGTNSSAELRIGRFKSATIQTVWAGHGTTSTFEVQETVDGTNWDTISGSSQTTSGTSGSSSIHLSDIMGDKIRITVTSADGGANPTLTPYIKLFAK